jgi:hypothetical protein
MINTINSGNSENLSFSSYTHSRKYDDENLSQSKLSLKTTESMYFNNNDNKTETLNDPVADLKHNLGVLNTKNIDNTSYPIMLNEYSTYCTKNINDVLTYSDGSKYKGGFLDGKRHGKGIMNWANGCVYEGDFVDDQYNGKGIYANTSGVKLEGNFLDGKLNGYGVRTYTNDRKELVFGKDGCIYTTHQHQKV